MRFYFLLLVGISGMTSLALEMCASRLLGAYFGTSLFIWANLIGLILLYLMLGYFLGGRFADRNPSQKALAALTTSASLMVCLIPFVCEPILTWSTSAISTVSVSVFYSSLLGTMLLFAIPVTLLGMVSPFAIRLGTNDLRRSGRTSGSLYAISTFGSILGSFLPVLWLIPTFGVRRTLLILGVALLAVSIAGLNLKWRSIFAVPALALVIIPLGPLKEIPDLIYSKESLYNYIQVTENKETGIRELVLNEGQAIHSVYFPDPHRVYTGWYWDYYLAAPYFNKDFQPSQLQSMAIIGLAGGTIAHQFTEVYGPVHIDGVEIDPEIIDVGQRYFGMNEPNLQVYAQDGRAFLTNTSHQYDMVAIDAFQQPYIPFQLTTQEFFQQIADHLSPSGVLTLNTGHTATDYRLVQAFVNTLSTIFPSVYVFNVPDTFNTEIMATIQPTSIAQFQSNLLKVPYGTEMNKVARTVAPLATVGQTEADGIVFTDDHSPIELITDQLLLNYIQHN